MDDVHRSNVKVKPKLPLKNKILPHALDSERKHMKTQSGSMANKSKVQLEEELSKPSVLEQTAGLDNNHSKDPKLENGDTTHPEKTTNSKASLKTLKNKINDLKMKLAHSPHDDALKASGDGSKFFGGREVSECALRDPDYHDVANDGATRKRDREREHTMQAAVGRVASFSQREGLQGPMSTLTKGQTFRFRDNDERSHRSNTMIANEMLERLSSLGVYGKFTAKTFVKKSSLNSSRRVDATEEQVGERRVFLDLG